MLHIFLMYFTKVEQRWNRMWLWRNATQFNFEPIFRAFGKICSLKKSGNFRNTTEVSILEMVKKSFIIIEINQFSK